EARQDVRRDGRDETDGQRAGQLIGAAGGAGDDVVDDLRHLSRVRQDAPAQRRDQHATGRTLDELDAEPALQGGQSLGQGGLGNAEALRGLAEVTGVRDRDEGAELRKGGAVFAITHTY